MSFCAVARLVSHYDRGPGPPTTLDLRDCRSWGPFVPELDQSVSSCGRYKVALLVVAALQTRDFLVNIPDDAIGERVECCRVEEAKRVIRGNCGNLVGSTVCERILPRCGGDDPVDVRIWW
jgi:hypothetical protein